VKSSIKNSGDLRAFLCNAMVDVRNGTLEVDKASVIQKLATQVNENMYAEVKVSKMLADAERGHYVLGQLPLQDAEQYRL
jgi:hypothetical protein